MTPEQVEEVFGPYKRIPKLGEIQMPLPQATIPTGSYWLDEQLGGGWPIGQVSEIYGDPGVGTSTLALHTLAEATHRGPCLFVDCGNAFDYEYASEIGVDLSYLLVTAEPECIPYMSMLTVIDGPPIPPRLIPEGQTVVLVGQGWPSRAATVKVRMRPDGIWKGGQTVTLEVVQNADAEVPRGWGSLYLHYNHGFSRVEEVLSLAFERELVTRKGSHYFLRGLPFGSSWEVLVRAIEKDPEMLHDIERLLRSP